MSIGFVMFGKALVLALWGIMISGWRDWKFRRSQQGIPLRFDKQRNVYVVSDWPEKLERGVWLVGQIFMWGGFACSMALCAYLYFGGSLI